MNKLKLLEYVSSAGCCVYWPVQKGTRICLYSLCALPRRLTLAARPLRPHAESCARREAAPLLACTEQHKFTPVQARRMCLIARARTQMTRKTHWPRCCSAARVVPPELALGEHLDPWIFVKQYLGQGFLEILIVAQAP